MYLHYFTCSTMDNYIAAGFTLKAMIIILQYIFTHPQLWGNFKHWCLSCTDCLIHFDVSDFTQKAHIP